MTRRHRPMTGFAALTLVAGSVTGGAAASAGSAAPDDGGLWIDGEQVADAELLAAAQEEGSLVLYTAYLEEAAVAFSDAFEEDTGISVDVIRLPPARLMERVLSEHGGDQLGGDIVQVSDPVNLEQLVDSGALTCDALPDDVVAELIESYADPDGCYYASSFSAMVIGYNTAVVDEEDAPTSFADLLDPQWKGMIGIIYAGVGGSSWSVSLMQRQQFGIEYWEGLAAQEPQILNSSSTLGEELQRGEIPIAIVSPSAALLAEQSGAPVKAVFPSDGMAPYGTYTALLDSAAVAHPNAALVFRNWAFTTRGQSQIQDTQLGAWAVRDGVPAPDGLPEVAELPMFVASNDDWVSLRESWVDEWNTIFGYTPE